MHINLETICFAEIITNLEFLTNFLKQYSGSEINHEFYLLILPIILQQCKRTTCVLGTGGSRL
jgi:hypothetical protein